MNEHKDDAVSVQSNRQHGLGMLVVWTLDGFGVYTFVDISQNNFQKQEPHWDRIEHIRRHLRSRPRPITNVKIYGSDNAPGRVEFWGNTRDGVERFWRNVFGLQEHDLVPDRRPVLLLFANLKHLRTEIRADHRQYRSTFIDNR